MKKVLVILMVTVLALSMSSLVLAQQEGAATASATLRDTNGTVVGAANFTEQTDGSVHVVVTLNGRLNAPGLHALHIYSVGSCSPDSLSAGGIFNPIGRKQHSNQPGVLPNIDIQAKGSTTYETWSSGFTLQSGGLSLFSPTGSSIVIRANADDMSDSPDGNNGDVIACGVIAAGTDATGSRTPTGTGATGTVTNTTGTGSTGVVTSTAGVTTTTEPPTTLPVTGGESDPTVGLIVLLLGAGLLGVSYLLRREKSQAH